MDIAYDSTVRGADTQRAPHTLRPQLVPSSAEPRLVRLEGDCPRCGHSTWWDHRLAVVMGTSGANESLLDELEEFLPEEAAAPGRGDITIDVRCRCGHQHQGQPAAAAGCGSSFRYRVVWG